MPLSRLAALLAIALAWAASLVLPAVGARGGPTWTGLELLLLGWEGAREGVFAWFANPLFVAALTAAALRRDGIAGVISAAAAMLALTSLAAEDILRGRIESVPELTFGAGFYLWIVAVIALCLRSWGAVYLTRRKLRRSR